MKVQIRSQWLYGIQFKQSITRLSMSSHLLHRMQTLCMEEMPGCRRGWPRFWSVHHISHVFVSALWVGIKCAVSMAIADTPSTSLQQRPRRCESQSCVVTQSLSVRADDLKGRNGDSAFRSQCVIQSNKAGFSANSQKLRLVKEKKLSNLDLPNSQCSKYRNKKNISKYRNAYDWIRNMEYIKI